MALINQYEIEQYIAATAKRADLTVNWTDARGEVHTNGKVITLPRITAATTKEEAEDLIGFVAHECGHILYSDFKYFSSKGLDPKHSFLGAIANLVEDDGVDAINAEEFYGDRIVRNESFFRILDSVEANFQKIKDKNGGEMPENMQAIATMLAWDCDNKGDYYSNTPLFIEKFEKFLGTKGQNWLKKLRAGDWSDRLKEIRTDLTRGRSRKAYQVAREIYEQVFDLNADEEEAKCKARAQAEGQAEEGDEEAEGRGGKEGDGKGKGKGGKGKYGPGGDKPRTEWVDVDYRPFMTDQHDEFISSRDCVKGMHINYSKYVHKRGDGYAPTPLSNTIVVDYPRGLSNWSRANPNLSDGGHNRFYDEHGSVHASEGFANKVRMLLQIRSKGKTQYGVKRGNLHPANTYRVVIKDAPGYNERVFKRTIKTDILDTAVIIVGDVSGSMSGAKHGHQMAACAQMNDAIGNALHIPLMMVGFTEHDCRNSMFIWRHFNDKLLSRQKLLQRMRHTSNYMSQNADGDAIMWAYYQIKRRKEKRKVMIVTSDGSPASSKAGDIYGYTKKVIEAIEADKSVDIVAIGIMDRNVEALYKQHSTIKRAEELEPALLSIIERKII